MKFVINTCYGGFCISREAMRKIGVSGYRELERNNPPPRRFD